ncbi:MAG: DUF47 family protein, partial [Nonomuraea sp.]|nr:DUF47 family protein [Nonomuraea sp.]
ALGGMSSHEARQRMSVVEHEGDAERAALVETLRGLLATPIDREDLFRLSRSVDDVLDHLRDFVREADLFAPPGFGFAVPLLDAVIDGLAVLEHAVDGLLSDPGGVTVAALAVRKAANRVRQEHQVELARALAGPFDADLLRTRELLRRLDAVGRRLVDAADALSDAMLKRSH